MSVSTVISEGFGSFGSISSVILQGFSIGEAVVVVTPPAATPSGGWAGRASYFFGHDRELAAIRGKEARRRAKDEARAEVARIAAESSPEDAAAELAAIRKAVAAESLAFGAFYRQLLDDAIARLRAEEEARMAAAAVFEAERQAAARRRDEEEVLLLVAML